MPFPTHRPRRLRRTAALRQLVQEVQLNRRHLIQPLFIVPGTGVKRPIASMAGQFHLSVDQAVKECERMFQNGISSFLLFGVPSDKDEIGSGAWRPDGLVQSAAAAIKRTTPEAAVIADVCLCEYTDHGHCGIVKGDAVDNDATLELLARIAVSLAGSGVDIVAPSDMMDGRVAAIRRALDDNGFSQTAILSYAVKHASAFYGPFRAAAASQPAFGDRRGYQMDPPNAREAMREIRLDIEEGADMILIKPAMPCLDLVLRARDSFPIPIGAYQTSGEHLMIEAAAATGGIARKRAIAESLIAIKRAGADFIISYFAAEAAEWIKNGECLW